MWRWCRIQEGRADHGRKGDRADAEGLSSGWSATRLAAISAGATAARTRSERPFASRSNFDTWDKADTIRERDSTEQQRTAITASGPHRRANRWRAVRPFSVYDRDAGAEPDPAFPRATSRPAARIPLGSCGLRQRVALLRAPPQPHYLPGQVGTRGSRPLHDGCSDMAHDCRARNMMTPCGGHSRGQNRHHNPGFELILTRTYAPNDRAYLRTHPWVDFTVNLANAPVDLWILLGEAQSKIEHLQGAPLKPYLQEELHKVYLAKGIHATSAIEGNTLTEEQVKLRIEGKLELPKSQEYLGREIDNLLNGYNTVMRELLAGSAATITVERVKELNQLVLDGLDLPNDVIPGGYRDHSVGIASYVAPPHQDCDFLIGRLCAWLDSDDFKPRELEWTVAWALLKAIVAHLYIVWIHPFGDGNGRTARLIEYQIMVGAGMPTVVGHLLSSHYNHTRTDYYLQLDRTSRGGQGPTPFICYAVRGFVDQLRQAIDMVRAQQLAIAWQNYVHQELDSGGAAHARQRHLLIALLGQREPVHRSKLSDLSPKVIKDYANKTTKTMTRDLNQLRSRGLLLFSGGGYKANTDLIRGFLPDRAQPSARKRPRKQEG
jgi:Fic family protein